MVEVSNIRLEDCLSFLLSKAAGRATLAFKRRLAPHGVTPAQYALLTALWDEDGQSCSALVDRLVLDPAAVTGLLDRLEAAGLVRRDDDPLDRRAWRVVLTDAGRALRAPLREVQREVNAELLADLPEEHARAFKATLAALGGVAPSPQGGSA